MPPLAALLLLAAAPFLVCVVRGETPFFLDLADHWFPFRYHAHTARTEGELAHWCSRAFSGFPFLAQLEAALCYPVHWVTDLFPPERTLLPQVIGHRFVFGALVYAVLRARGLSRGAGLLGGALAIASGITMSCFSQPAVLRTLAWIPLVFLGAVRLAQGRRLEGMLWTAAGTALTLVAGYPPFLQRAAIALPFLYLLDPAAPRTAAEWKDRALRFLCAGAGAALGAAIAAAQLLPAAELTQTSQRQLGLDPELLDLLRAEPTDLLMLVLPRPDRDCGVAKQGFAYLGVIVFALATLAVLRRRPGALALAAAGGAALLASMGKAMPVVGDVLAALPLAGSFRNPSQYLVAWIVVVPLLAALGLQSWRDARPSRREALVSLGVAGALVVVAALVPEPVSSRAAIVRLGIAAAALGAGVAALFLPRGGWVLVLGAAVADAGSFQFNYPTREGRTRKVSDVARPDAPFAVVAARHRETGRDGPPRCINSEAVFNLENHGFVAGVDNVRGLVSLLPLHALDLARVIERGAPFERVPPKEPLYGYGPNRALADPKIDLLAIRYAVGFPAPPGPAWRAVGPGVFERDAAGEARLARRVVVHAPPGDGPDEHWRALLAPDFDPSRDVAVPHLWRDDPPAPVEDPGTVRQTSRTTNTVTFEVTARAPTLLLWCQTRDDGWSAERGAVGEPAASVDIVPANWAHMAVPVPAGTSVVTFRYASPGWERGVRVSVAALVLFAGLAAGAFVAARRRRAVAG